MSPEHSVNHTGREDWKLDAPQHLHGFGEAHIVEVEVEETGKAQDAERVPDVLDERDELDQVVRQNASHSPMAMEVDKRAEEVVNESSLEKEGRRHDTQHGHGNKSLHFPVSRCTH